MIGISICGLAGAIVASCGVCACGFFVKDQEQSEEEVSLNIDPSLDIPLPELEPVDFKSLYKRAGLLCGIFFVWVILGLIANWLTSMYNVCSL